MDCEGSLSLYSGDIAISWCGGIMRLFLAITALLLASVIPVSAYTVDVGAWQIRYFVPDRVATGCIMGGNYQDGTRLSVVVSKGYEWGLGLSNLKWNLQKGGTTDVAVYVDRQFIASGKATHLNSSIALLPLTGATAYRALQVGHGLVLQTSYGNLSFALSNTAKAMAATLDCVKTLNPATQEASNPPRSDFQQLSQAETAVILTNLLNAAGIQGYRLNPPKQGSHFVSYSLSDGSTGLFLAARGLGTKTADDYAGFAIGRWSEFCKGEFMSGKQSIPSVDGSVVRKVVTTCRTGEKAVATETTIVRQANGFLMDLSQIIPASAAIVGNDKDRGALVNAAIQMRDAR
jgi:hypothetical protein